MGLLLTGTPMSWSPFSSSSSSSSSSTRQACSPLIQLFFGFASESVFVNSTNISKILRRQRCLSSTSKNHLTSLAPSQTSDNRGSSTISKLAFELNRCSRRVVSKITKGEQEASHNWNGYDQPAACKPKSCAESYKRPPTLP